MATTIFVPPFQDPQLKQFAQQVVSALMGSTASAVQVGQGNPTIVGTKGDTYWNATDNNFWIYDNNVWNILETGINESIFFGQVAYFIPPQISGLWDTTKITLIPLTLITTTGTTFNNFSATTDVNGNITVSYVPVDGLTVSLVGNGTTVVQVIATHKVGPSSCRS